MKENLRSSASIWTEGDIRWILPARLAALLGSSALATALLLTTETLVVEKKEEEPEPAGHGHGHAH